MAKSKSAYSIPGKIGKIERHIIVVWVDNEAGVLARVVGLFSGRGYNIDSLHVDPIEDFEPFRFIEDELGIKFQVGEVSRLTIQTTVGDKLMRQILRQINKLIEVIAVSDDENTYLKGILRNENLL